MSLEYWFMFPVAIIVAILANSSGFSGSVLFQPIYNLILKVPIQNSVATGIATETVGMISGAFRYFLYKMLEFPVGFTMMMLTIPGVVLGNYALLIINGNLLKLFLGAILLALAFIQLYATARNSYGKRENVPIEDMYPFMWIPPLGGFFSASTGTGIAEISQPLLERGLGVKTRRANGTAILVECTGDCIITILNLHAGLILKEIWVFAAAGVILGGQIGPCIAKYLPEKLLKIVFSIAIILVGIFYIYNGISWLLTVCN